jgi:alpha-ketoglutarate-dependent taurine dioxygenase
MSQTSGSSGSSRAFTIAKRRAHAVEEPIVTARTLDETRSLPLLMEPAGARVDLRRWIEAHVGDVRERLHRHGVLLFRGFGLATAEDFHACVAAFVPELMTYRERSSPRTEVARDIYTSTDYPADRPIFPHNEHSYALTFPLLLAFFCAEPPATGGATPVADTRKVFARLRAETRDRFARRGGWLYVRNFDARPGMGLAWPTVFQTDDPARVEEYCQRAGIVWSWKADGRLHTRQQRPVTIRHPRTGEPVWFNHATFFHLSTLPADIQASLQQEYAESELPNQTYYGDGTPIEDDVLEELRQAYLAELVAVPWQRGDLMLIDNVLAAHAREAFSGPRSILCAMADPHSRTDV